MLERGRYGVEWTARPKDREFSGLVRVGAIVMLLAIVSLTWSLVRKSRSGPENLLPEEESSVVQAATNAVAVDLSPAVPLIATESSEVSARPAKLRNLLMRLEEAEKRRDVEMAIATIESIRALPGSPAADLDNALARRLGKLNLQRLFVLKNAQWVTSVTIKSGDTASRIASERGATLASVAKLNGGDVTSLRIGQKLLVLNHPRFNLVIHRRMRTADLFLNGKFFKRYDLLDEKGVDGRHEVTMPIRDFWSAISVRFKSADRDELELLLPKGASVLVSEI